MKLTKAFKTNKEHNEDHFFSKDDAFMVIDGASALGEKVFEQYGSDTYWIHQYIEKNWDLLNQPKEFFLKSTKDMAKDYVVENATTYQMPSAGVIYTLFSEEQILISGVGDCVALVELNDGSVQHLFDSPLEQLDGAAIQELLEIQKQKNLDSPLEGMQYISKTLRKNRDKLNQLNGYGVLAPKEIPLEFVKLKTFKKHEVKNIALMTDGVYQYVDTLNMGNDQQLMQQIVKYGVKKVTEQVYEKQLSDSSANKYPRLKVSDDMCLVLIEEIN